MCLPMEKEQYVTQDDSSIEEAWSKIEINRHRSIIIIKKNKVVGTLSDGDIRKAILLKRLLSTPVKEIMNVNFISISKNEINKTGEIFKEKNIFLLPVVDEKMHLIDIVVK